MKEKQSNAWREGSFHRPHHAPSDGDKVPTREGGGGEANQKDERRGGGRWMEGNPWAALSRWEEGWRIVRLTGPSRRFFDFLRAAEENRSGCPQRPQQDAQKVVLSLRGWTPMREQLPKVDIF